MKLLLKQITFNFHVHHQIVLQVAENVAQNESFVLSKVTPASKVPPFDGTTCARVIATHRNFRSSLHVAWLKLQFDF